MNKLIWVFFLSTIVISCNKNKTYNTLSNDQINKEAILFDDSNFNNTMKLKSIELSDISDSLIFSGTLVATKNYLLINEIKTDKFIHIIKLPEERYLGKYGNKGKGPGEIIRAWPFSKSEEGNLIILDQRQKKIVEINPDSLIINNSFEKEYHLSPSIECDGVSINNNKIFFLNVGDTTSRLFETNLKGHNLKGYGKLPQLSYSSKNIEFLNQIYWSDMDYKKSLFGISYRFMPLLQIFNKEKNKWTTLIGPENFMPSEQNYRKRTFYNMIKITSNYIYALYNGKNMDKKDWQDANVIYVFNFEGKFIKKLILDRGIRNFEVFEDKFIYGLGGEVLGTRLLKFDILKGKR
ncbi:BF3164 family lipoprotein [Flavobacterium undicola]|uniref:BF3164 family lipoprotein n=1 Tax=Flavobacterium undicola TaxID=1932779 RepID=UPI00137841BD|nr:BF3164 family lipoprotein [Flavobacterium undicola]MBA0884909.1 hypothetical protein [Flavobacterium undicola]